MNDENKRDSIKEKDLNKWYNKMSETFDIQLEQAGKFWANLSYEDKIKIYEQFQ